MNRCQAIIEKRSQLAKNQRFRARSPDGRRGTETLAVAGTTQTVALVQGAITNQVGTKVVGATDRMLVLTNAPWLFAGDAVRVTTSATNAFGAVLVGEAQD